MLEILGFPLGGSNKSSQDCLNWSGIHLSNNRLGGQIPSALAQCRDSLATIDLSINHLVGPIPSSLGSLKFLYLSGTILASITRVSSLGALDLRNNKLEGDLGAGTT